MIDYLIVGSGLYGATVAALRNEQFFSFDALNREIRKKLDEYNNRPIHCKRRNP